MTEEEKRASLTDAQRVTLGEFESLLKIYEAMRWLKAVPTKAPVADTIVWAREIPALRVTLALTATKESLGAKTILVRKVDGSGLSDESVSLNGLAKKLEMLVGYGPNDPSARRPNQPLRRSRPRRRR